MQIYHVETQEDYDALMVELEGRGYLWLSNKKPNSRGNRWLRHKENFCVIIDNKMMTYADIRWCKKHYLNATIQKHKAKQNDVQSAIETVSQNNAELFHKIITDLEQTYLAKNKDYGNSFEESLNEFGEVAGIVRIGDKFNRAKNLSKNKANVTDESKIDTYLDMANYNIMQAMWLMKKED